MKASVILLMTSGNNVGNATMTFVIDVSTSPLPSVAQAVLTFG